MMDYSEIKKRLSRAASLIDCSELGNKLHGRKRRYRE